ncbi:MerR family transcriptional regulator [Nocardia stercoris]|uniref:MerR family transcriptional regulator n=1 Tax=Nocardia stercoris TaxID=2483361 RepID=A0A3M2L9A5_9NOCA|nr:MerR family transcriptional regulator [Nocardia stercoris]RMI33290.1 MerR family transcriptional regulator [Nocardia stercoris]
MLIGEVSRRCGVSTRMLRHYDTLGLVRPTGRTSGGYREYTTADIARLFHVECLRTLGLSLHDAKRALDDPEFAPADLVGDLIDHTRARIAAERELLHRLERVDAAAPADWSDVTGVVALLRALESDSGAARQQAVLTQHGGALPVAALVEAALAEDDANVAGALRWSLARAGGAGLAGLAAGLDAPEPEIRRRAAGAIAAVPTAAATGLLRTALADSDPTVRDRAALALGARRDTAAVAALLDMIVAGRADIEAAEALGVIAAGPTTADSSTTDIAATDIAAGDVSAADSGAEIVTELRATLTDTGDPAVRLRITQALAEIPGPAAHHALTELTTDSDRTVAATATAIIGRRDH